MPLTVGIDKNLKQSNTQQWELMYNLCVHKLINLYIWNVTVLKSFPIVFQEMWSEM